MIGLLLLAALSGSGAGAPALEPGVILRLAPGETAADPDGRLAVTFLEVEEDSRCPEGARCIWEGNARVRLRLVEDGKEREARINSTLEPREAALGDLVLRFGDLTPHPRLGEKIAPETYRLVLSVRRAGEDD